LGRNSWARVDGIWAGLAVVKNTTSGTYFGHKPGRFTRNVDIEKREIGELSETSRFMT
jgi:hypothetical protein